MNYSFLARNENHWIHFSYQYCLKHRKLNYPRDGQFLCIMDPLDPQYGTYGIPCFDPVALLLWMEEILHHLGWLKPYKQWDKPSINWCRISSIHRSTHVLKIWLLIFFPGSHGFLRKIWRSFFVFFRLGFRRWVLAWRHRVDFWGPTWIAHCQTTSKGCYQCLWSIWSWGRSH